MFEIKEVIEPIEAVATGGKKKKYEQIVTNIKGEIRKNIEKVLAVNVGKIFNEREIAVLMVDATVYLHNKYAAGYTDIDVTKLIHEVFCSLFCEYLGFSDSGAVRYFAWYTRESCSNDFTDYIGFKF